MLSLDRLDRYGLVPEIEQLVKQEQFDDMCVNRAGICVFAFLPHIYDSTSEQRRNYFEMLKEVFFKY